MFVALKNAADKLERSGADCVESYLYINIFTV